jgi:nucleosome binding factor SPN SPT16 subunit
MVRSSCWWSVESKEFDLSVVGGSIGIRIREKCKGVTRSILLDKDEAVWLIKSYDELVTVQDSGVF